MKDYFIEDTSNYDHIIYAGLISLAGALVDADYIIESNAIPTVMFHGTKDQLVPFATAAHHYCSKEQKGYLVLNGSETIAMQLDNLQTSYYFHKVVGGGHDIANIPFDQLDRVFEFLNRTVLNSELIQTKKTIFKD